MKSGLSHHARNSVKCNVCAEANKDIDYQTNWSTAFDFEQLRCLHIISEDEFRRCRTQDETKLHKELSKADHDKPLIAT